MADTYVIAADKFRTAPKSTSDPARLAVAVTPSDTEDFTNAAGMDAHSYSTALYIGTTGDVTVVTAGDSTNGGAGTAVTFSSVPVGWFPVQCRRVMNTGTTAANIVALFP